MASNIPPALPPARMGDETRRTIERAVSLWHAIEVLRVASRFSPPAQLAAALERFNRDRDTVAGLLYDQRQETAIEQVHGGKLVEFGKKYRCYASAVLDVADAIQFATDYGGDVLEASNAAGDLDELRLRLYQEQDVIEDKVATNNGAEPPAKTPGPTPPVETAEHTPEAGAGYLSLSVDHIRRTITRQGHPKIVDDIGPADWPLLVAMIKAEAGGLTKDAAENAYAPGEVSAIHEAKKRIKERLIPLAITIPHGKFKLVADGI